MSRTRKTSLQYQEIEEKYVQALKSTKLKVQSNKTILKLANNRSKKF